MPSDQKTVQERTADLLVEHMLISDDRPGGSITCSCRRWDSKIGDTYSDHVTQQLRGAGLLAPSTTADAVHWIHGRDDVLDELVMSAELAVLYQDDRAFERLRGALIAWRHESGDVR